jgi:CRP/FNR family transcriptional regulator, cyclic AMP receptor protein
MTTIELFVKQVPLFQSLDPAVSRRIGELLRERYLNKGDILFRKGDEGTALYLITRGKIKISVTSRLGDEVTLAVMAAGDFFGEMALLDGMPRSADAVALEDTDLLFLNRTEFLSVVMENENAVKAILAALALRLRKADDFLADTCFMSIASRLAKRLVEFAQAHGQPSEGSTDVIVSLTQTELASMIGVTRESINKQLRVLKDKGFVSTAPRQITIHNVELLKKRIR